MVIVGIVGLLVGIGAGALVAYLLCRARAVAETGVLAERLEAGRQRAEDLGLEIEQMRQRHTEQQQCSDQQNAEIASLKATREIERKNAQEKLQLLEEARKSLATEFENLANRIFEEKREKFVAQNREKLGEVLRPLKDQLADFRKRVDDVHTAEMQGRTSLVTELRHLRELNQQVSSDAVNLTNALKGESKTQGQWGELILERVLEQSGLQRGREYETQVHLREKYGEHRSRYPDVVVHLPEKKDVIIDSKVSLKDYERFCSATDDQEREIAFKAHLKSLRNHMAELGDKKYEELTGINALDLVVMCVPSESALIAAVSREQGLYEEAFSKHIMLVGPSTLLLTLRIIATIWRHEYQNRNAQEIADRGKQLYDKFVGFLVDLEKVNKLIRDAGVACDSATAKLSTGNGNLVGQAEKLIELGVKARKKMPVAYLKQNSSLPLSAADDA